MTKRFLFDNVFDIRDSAGEKGVIAARAKPRYVDEETLTTTREQAFAAGRAEGARDAYGEIGARIANGVETVSARLELLLHHQSEMIAALERDAAILADVIARKLAATVMAAHPFAEVEALIGECVAAMHDEPRIVVTLPPELVEPFRERLGGIIEQNGYRGQIVLKGDAKLGEFDCAVEWPNGGLARDAARLEQALSEAVARFVSSGRSIETAGGTAGPSE